MKPLKHLLCFSLLLTGLSACDPSSPSIAKTQPLPGAEQTGGKTLDKTGLRDAKILVFSKTKGWRHDSIPTGIETLKHMATENFFSVDATEDASAFTDSVLSKYHAIVFLNTSLDVLNDDQQIAMERYIQAGGGFVGIHSAADTEWEGDWYWYRRLVGGVFKNHPNEPSNVQNARIDVVNSQHPSTEKLPLSFEIQDEWYNYRDIYSDNKVLMTVDEKSYRGGEHGDYHPIAWYKEFDGGRSFYTGLGHSIDTFNKPEFQHLLLGGIQYAVGGKPKLDYAKSRPENNRFLKKELVRDLNEPVNFTFFKNGDALIAERQGTIKLVKHDTGETSEIGKVDVAYLNFLEMGLLGLAVDPAFDRTHFIYASLNYENKDGELIEALARFKMVDGKIDNSTREILLEFKENRNCCHTGGDLEFDAEGNLYMSTGDNSNPHDQHGYAPIDFRADAEKNDSLRSAGNTQDLRGKIIRIKPLEKGGYDIPNGNLFTDKKEGRPEIYVMGARNPYKIAVDSKKHELFFGDVGPDAGEDSVAQGPRGYDEINRATKAGNFGWPLFIGNNYAYREYDYSNQTSGKLYNPLKPVNNSPRNTGAHELPPAQGALLWYPYGASQEFPDLGKGGRAALAAGVFNSDEYKEAKLPYPAHYDGKLFITDFMRNWVKVVSFDSLNRVKSIEPFAPNIDYAAPIDAKFGPDGNLYVLEYGKAWFKGNPEAALSKIEYVGAGNRPPVAVITLPKHQGAAPFSGSLSAEKSYDLDGDDLAYTWTITPEGQAEKAKTLPEGLQTTVSIAEKGRYLAKLIVKDPSGATATAETLLEIGNEPAVIDTRFAQNNSFFWPSDKKLNYTVKVSDKEDGQVANGDANLFIDFTAQSQQKAAEGHQQADVATVALELMRANGCKSCHSVDTKVVGPAFKDVAARYKNDKNAVKYLVNKIGKGGNGAWGELNMPSFATLSEADRTALATYVLSLANLPKSLPLQGEVAIVANPDLQKEVDSSDEPHTFDATKYEFNVAYTDKGVEQTPPIKVVQKVVLSSPRYLIAGVLPETLQTKELTIEKFKNKSVLKVVSTGNWSVIPLGNIDTRSLSAIKLGLFAGGALETWQFEVRLGSDTGTVIASGEYSPKGLDTYERAKISFLQTGEQQELYLAVKGNKRSAAELNLYDIYFQR